MKKAFTLVEIMVSVAIMVLLLAIIFPLLSRAKWEAHYTASSSNLKQIYAGTMLYIADTDGYYPHNRNDEFFLLLHDPEVTMRTLPTDSPSPGRLIDSLAPYVGSKDVFFFTPDPYARQNRMGGFINHMLTSYRYVALPLTYNPDTWKGWPLLSREGEIYGRLWENRSIGDRGQALYPKIQDLFENGSVKSYVDPDW